MRLLPLILIAIFVGATPSAIAQVDPRLNGNKLTQLEAGVNPYDLKLRNLWPEDHADMAVICAAASGVMAFKFEEIAKTDQDRASAKSLQDISGIWIEEAAIRRGITIKESNETYVIPAWGMMRNLDHDTLSFWLEHCLELTRKALPAQD